MSQLQNVLGNFLRKTKNKKTIAISTNTNDNQDFDFEPIKLSIQLPYSNKRRKSINHISLQITIDAPVVQHQEQHTKKDMLPINTKVLSCSSNSSTSGYSSSSSVDYKQDDHLYDKLNYSNKRRYSISSSSSTTNDYEEISNFTAINLQTPENEDTYESLYDYKSSVVKKIPRLNENNLKLKGILKKTTKLKHEEQQAIIRKHEYSINEIFQNLNSFKKQAKEQQKHRQEDHLYVNERLFLK